MDTYKCPLQCSLIIDNSEYGHILRSVILWENTVKRSNEGPNIWLYSEACSEPGKLLVVNYFRKRLHLRYLAGFGTCIWYLIFSINIWGSGLFSEIFLEVTIPLMITWKFFLNITWWVSWILLANFFNLKPFYTVHSQKKKQSFSSKVICTGLQKGLLLKILIPQPTA